MLVVICRRNASPICLLSCVTLCPSEKTTLHRRVAKLIVINGCQTFLSLTGVPEAASTIRREAGPTAIPHGPLRRPSPGTAAGKPAPKGTCGCGVWHATMGVLRTRTMDETAISEGPSWLQTEIPHQWAQVMNGLRCRPCCVARLFCDLRRRPRLPAEEAVAAMATH